MDAGAAAPSARSSLRLGPTGSWPPPGFLRSPAPEGQPLERRFQDRAPGNVGVAAILDGVERTEAHLVPGSQGEPAVVPARCVDDDPSPLDPDDVPVHYSEPSPRASPRTQECRCRTPSAYSRPTDGAARQHD